LRTRNETHHLLQPSLLFVKVMSLSRKLLAEALGTMLLLAAVVGSGIMGERLSGGNVAIALLANTIATGATLVAIILAFGGRTGANYKPGGQLAIPLKGGLPCRKVGGYVLAQMLGACFGVAAANVMFGEPVFALSHHARSGGAQLFSEFVATFGLFIII